MRDERRHRQPGRRESDAEAFSGAAVVETVVEEIADAKITWRRLLAIAAAVGTIGGGIIWLGGRFVGPGEVFREHQKDMQAVKDRVQKVEQRIDNVENALDLMSYLLCVQIRRSDPTAVPPRCNDPSIRRIGPR